MSIHITNAIAYPGNTTPTIQISTGQALGLGGANYGTSGQVVTSQGSGSAPIWSAIAIGAPTVQVFTSSGTYTPTSGKTNFLVFCVGGGGGSSGTLVHSVGGQTFNIPGIGGGSGGCAWRYYNSTEMGSSASITIGSGGAAGSYSTGGFFGFGAGITAGGIGGSSTFNPGGTGVTLTGGGGGGGYATGLAGGSGGSSTNSTVEWIGNYGKNKWSTSPGRGGASLIFGGGRGGDGNYTGASGVGQAGSSGCVVIFEY